MPHECVVQAMTNRAFERLVKNPTLAQAVELLQLGLELFDVPGAPLLDNRRIETAQLRDMKQRPGPLDHGWSSWAWQPVPQRESQFRQWAREGDLSCRIVERCTLQQQAHREEPAECHGEVSCRHTVWALFDLTNDAGPSSQGQQLGAQIVGTFVIGDAELSEGVGNRGKGAPFGSAVLAGQPRQAACPRAALCGK
jgi:hypothetical protein